jgi:hypothetical protein
MTTSFSRRYSGLLSLADALHLYPCICLSVPGRSVFLVVEMVGVVRAKYFSTDDVAVLMIFGYGVVGATGSPAGTLWRPMKC